MPPKKELMDVSIKVITPAETEKVTLWIAAGAPESNIQLDVADGKPDPLVSDKDRHWWSFQPPKRPAIPQLRNAGRVRNPIDAFVLARLEENSSVPMSPQKLRLQAHSSIEIPELH